MLSAETVKKPLIVIATYFFDSIPHEVFYVEDGQLHECMVTLSRP